MGKRTGRRLYRREGKLSGKIEGQLVEYAEWQFELGRVDENGISLKKHLEQIYKSTKVKPEQLEAPAFPESVRHVWQWFTELHEARPRTGMGVSPLLFSEIQAWSAMTGSVPTPWELGVIKSIDRAYMAANVKG